jgi:IS1 family transposase
MSFGTPITVWPSQKLSGAPTQCRVGCLANSSYRATSSVLKKEEAKLAKNKKVVRREWSKEDVRTLKTMARDKQGVTKIAKALKRSIGATSVMSTRP